MWEFFAKLNLTSGWQFTPLVEGDYFRVSPALTFVRGHLCQAELNPLTTFQLVRLSGQNHEVLYLPKPVCFVSRSLGLRLTQGDAWEVSIEKYVVKAGGKK